MICKSEEDVILYVTTVTSKRSEQIKLTETSDLTFLRALLILDIVVAMSGVVHTGVEVRRMDSEMSGLVE